jgi:ribonuclease P protein component
MHYPAGKRFTVKHRRDIDRVFRAGRRAADATLTLFVVPNGLDRARLGVGVSSRHGNAVKRNRVKRLCREAFRLSRMALPSGQDYMMIPRPGADLTLQTIRASLTSLAARLSETGEKEART